jgi:hypothetical protein
MAGTACALAWLAWGIRSSTAGAHALPFDEMLRRANDSGPVTLLFFIPLLFACIPIGLFIANMIIWSIPSARRAFQREAVGVWHASFSDAQKDMILLTLCISLPAFVTSIVGALLFRM